MVDFRITWTLCIGEVRKPRLPGHESVYVFFAFTITTNNRQLFATYLFPIQRLLIPFKLL